jgi:hypothetical protein
MAEAFLELARAAPARLDVGNAHAPVGLGKRLEIPPRGAVVTQRPLDVLSVEALAPSGAKDAA